ncbi:squalene synthase HpnC [Dactylosporangium sp. CA-139066]|uniref:squalene synthase HpnC n=1 Tax=Dactylosporangium sp. CA-139066 TaxID=3239930 RepID=UPI003D93C39E
MSNADRFRSARQAENFPVALRVLPARVRAHLEALYGYARYVDDLGDEPDAVAGGRSERLAALDAVARAVDDLYAGRPVAEPVVRALGPCVAACDLPADPLLRLVEANRVDQVVTRYATFDQLVRYCILSANPVGELVLHVFGRASEERVALSDRICTALQIIEHLQDVAEDHRRGRVYLPGEDMKRFGVSEGDLSGDAATPALRDLIALTAQRAAAWLESGAPLVSSLDGWARLAVGGYVAGGRAALTSLARAGHDPLANRVVVPRRLVLRHWMAAALRAAG